MNIEDFLRKFVIFSDLSPEEFVGIARVFFQRRFTRGDTLLREGEVSPQLILIESGEVQVYKGFGKGGQLLGTRYMGESLGEFTVFGTEPHSATAIATTDVSAYVALGPDVNQLVNDNVPGAGKIMVRILGVAVDRFRKMEQKSVMSGSGGLYEPSIENRLINAMKNNEMIRVSFYSGSEKDVEGNFRLIDISSELGVPLVRLAMDLEARGLHGKDIRVREYVIPMSGLHFISFDSTAKT